MIDEDGDAAREFAGREGEITRPTDAQWPIWAGSLRTAWRVLRDDRHYGAMGGAGQIFFTAIDRYADRRGLRGGDFDRFLFFVRELDAEFIAYLDEQAAEAEARAKAGH